MIEKYEKFIGEHELDSLFKIAERIKDLSILHVNSTKAGGGVAEILNRMVPLMKELGLNVDWRVIKGDNEFFNVTKSFHNSLQNGIGNITEEHFRIYDKWQELNLSEIPLDYDVMFIHDPQPAGLIKFKKGNNRWIWRCHIDISNPYPPVWDFLKKYVSEYNASIISVPSFGRDDIDIPQFIIPPSIDPLSEKNKHISETTKLRIMSKFGISEDKPLVTQISRFDYAKDPLGVIKAYKLAKRHVDLQLAYVGSPATDDPEGEKVYNEVIRESRDDKDIHILMLPPYSDLEINAFQSASTVVMQKSIKEGFGLTVSEAMWKNKPVIGGNTGGIPLQVINGVTGFLVNSPQGAAHYTIYLTRNAKVRHTMGTNAREHVRRNFLITRELRDYLMTIMYVNERNSV
ncbi:glycosyltransferase [Sulfolobus acidocaldarius]|uniref:Glycosyl transferase group 1 n=4 Tax=Sulfolobus acidocaldarius TaxID=2285 RepID=Q4J7U8_SULAC|nr:glycosyltransferase [Sulfolobus acidocaldarius]AAY81133.1 glycosyl transferase group 1 [Sulfolobus acidocaldarius DSM 639]AGE71743.1 glycosyl transferase group 1 [Sulfolobus acidocaldarius N8]AGE74016.1 glycosyl transferase group 1 [Sulfolobus acidocaldarius Ron12/I]ALU30054.1 glycosyl transferase family 1 [Sulfolobus acidocaldarius]ALU30744.1 glycosyl transferase family 1 [Sulfolobus acidocaldarius]